jgi:GNAT superfamily N-acetyltransferase
MILKVMTDLRTMLPGDVDTATEMILANDWGVRREWLALAASMPTSVPLVAVDAGRIVGTGVGTANGSVGWIGTIFIEPAWRGQGLGRAITQSIIDRLESAGCRTLILVATAEGRRLYEHMGFEIQTRYRIFEAPGLPASDGAAAAGARVRAFRADDLDAIRAIDLDGTGEDREQLLRRLAAPETARVALDPGGSVAGFVIRAPWGGGATVARSSDAALDLIAARRVTAGPEGRVRVGILRENDEGLDRLVELGFTPQWSAPRMIRGEAMTWHPERIWGQFNHAVG